MGSSQGSPFLDMNVEKIRKGPLYGCAERSMMDVGEWELYDSGMARMDRIGRSD